MFKLELMLYPLEVSVMYMETMRRLHKAGYKTIPEEISQTDVTLCGGKISIAAMYTCAKFRILIFLFTCRGINKRLHRHL